MAGFQLTLYGRIWVTPEVPGASATADEVQRALEESLIKAAGLEPTLTFEEMEAEYKAGKERQRLEQTAGSSPPAR